jgi:hypothetical protein
MKPGILSVNSLAYGVRNNSIGVIRDPHMFIRGQQGVILEQKHTQIFKLTAT